MKINCSYLMNIWQSYPYLIGVTLSQFGWNGLQNALLIHIHEHSESQGSQQSKHINHFICTLYMHNRYPGRRDYHQQWRVDENQYKYDHKGDVSVELFSPRLRYRKGDKAENVHEVTKKEKYIWFWCRKHEISIVVKICLVVIFFSPNLPIPNLICKYVR